MAGHHLPPPASEIGASELGDDLNSTTLPDSNLRLRSEEERQRADWLRTPQHGVFAYGYTTASI